jgi:hypothetical protein
MKGRLGQPLELLDVRLIYCDPADLRFPIVEGGALRWVNSLFPEDRDWEGIICLEELPQCPPLVQAAAMQLTLDRRVGDYVLPDGATIVACGNRQEDRAGAHRLLTPLISRLIHLELDVRPEDWTDWALENGVHASVVSLIQYKPGLLHQFDPAKNEPFPSPRTWHYASDALRCLPEDLRLPVLTGCVGKGAAAELVGFMEIEEGMKKKYPIERILADPAGAPVPPLSEGAILWALGGALAERARAKDKQTVHAAMTYAMRLPVEFAAFAVRATIKAGGGVMALSAPGASEFVAKNKSIILAESIILAD